MVLYNKYRNFKAKRTPPTLSEGEDGTMNNDPDRCETGILGGGGGSVSVLARQISDKTRYHPIGTVLRFGLHQQNVRGR